MKPLSADLAAKNVAVLKRDPRIATHINLLIEFNMAVAEALLELSPVTEMMEGPMEEDDRGGELARPLRAKTRKLATLILLADIPVLSEGLSEDPSGRSFKEYANDVAMELAQLYAGYLERGAEVYPYHLVTPMGAMYAPDLDAFVFTLATRYSARIWNQEP